MWLVFIAILINSFLFGCLWCFLLNIAIRWLNFLPALIFTRLGKNGLGEKKLIKKSIKPMLLILFFFFLYQLPNPSFAITNPTINSMNAIMKKSQPAPTPPVPIANAPIINIRNANDAKKYPIKRILSYYPIPFHLPCSIKLISNL